MVLGGTAQRDEEGLSGREDGMSESLVDLLNLGGTAHRELFSWDCETAQGGC